MAFGSLCWDRQKDSCRHGILQKMPVAFLLFPFYNKRRELLFAKERRDLDGTKSICCH